MAGVNTALLALAAGAVVIVGVLMRIASRVQRRQPIDVGTVSDSGLAERRSLGND